MKQNTFLMKTDFLENLIYDGFENGPRTVMGQQGAYQRHHVANAAHGSFDVITKTLTDAVPEGAQIVLVNPIFYPDFIHGNQIAPALNVFATDIKVLGGKN